MYIYIEKKLCQSNEGERRMVFSGTIRPCKFALTRSRCPRNWQRRIREWSIFIVYLGARWRRAIRFNDNNGRVLNLRRVCHHWQFGRTAFNYHEIRKWISGPYRRRADEPWIRVKNVSEREKARPQKEESFEKRVRSWRRGRAPAVCTPLKAVFIVVTWILTQGHIEWDIPIFGIFHISPQTIHWWHFKKRP